jgi:hypothetical protein
MVEASGRGSLHMIGFLRGTRPGVKLRPLVASQSVAQPDG